MILHDIYKRHVLRLARERCPACVRGRPRPLGDSEALDGIFRVLRTGIQWRELGGGTSYVTTHRRMSLCITAGVFSDAYRDTLRVYRKFRPTTHYAIDSHPQINSQNPASQFQRSSKRRVARQLRPITSQWRRRSTSADAHASFTSCSSSGVASSPSLTYFYTTPRAARLSLRAALASATTLAFSADPFKSESSRSLMQHTSS